MATNDFTTDSNSFENKNGFDIFSALTDEQIETIDKGFCDLTTLGPRRMLNCIQK